MQRLADEKLFFETGTTGRLILPVLTKLIFMTQSKTYFDTQAGAIDSAVEMATKKGYEVVFPDRIWTEHVSYGSMGRYIIELTKNGKPSRRTLVIVLYRMDKSGKYELTTYIG